MNVIFDAGLAQTLKENFVVLDLPQHQSVNCYVILGQESIPFDDMQHLDDLRALHNALVQDYVQGRRAACLEAIPRLRGRFSGELDSFYDHVQQEFSSTTQDPGS
jgi:hypothetical protein